MTTRIHSELRRLSLAYYRGWIKREQYLSTRQEYLQAISNDKNPAAIASGLISAPKKKTKTPEKTVPTTSGNNKILIIAISVIVLLLIIAGIFIGQDSAPTQPIPTIDNTPAATPVTINKPKSYSAEEQFNIFLTDNFIGNKTWPQNTLNSLKLKWLGLSQEQQQNIKASSTFQNFSGALVERIIEERKINSVVPSDYELNLMTTAKNMGLTNTVPAP